MILSHLVNDLSYLYVKSEETFKEEGKKGNAFDCVTDGYSLFYCLGFYGEVNYEQNERCLYICFQSQCTHGIDLGTLAPLPDVVL